MSLAGVVLFQQVQGVHAILQKGIIMYKYRLISPLLLLLAISGCNEAPEIATVPTIAAAEVSSGSLSTLLGEHLVNAGNEQVHTDEVQAQKIALYFSALWCPPCRNFTPLLVDAYNEMQAAGEPFEVVFVSADRSAEAMHQYMVDYKMPWLAIPFDEEARSTLPQQHRVRGIPQLLIMDADGNVLKANAVMDVRDHGAAAFSRW